MAIYHIPPTTFECKDVEVIVSLSNNNSALLYMNHVTKTISLLVVFASFSLYTFMFFFSGYLMSERESHAQPSTFECVDAAPEAITGLLANTDGALFYFIRTDCSGTATTGHCPPYQANKELTCVVCSK